MVNDILDDIFQQAAQVNNNIYLNEDQLNEKYFLTEFKYRDKELKELAEIFSPIIKGNKMRNTLIYGKEGRGKKLVLNSIINKISSLSNFKIIEIDCKASNVSKTEYQFLLKLLPKITNREYPSTGLGANILFREVEESLLGNSNIVIILDNIDYLIQKLKSKEFIEKILAIEGNFSLMGISEEVIPGLFDELILFKDYDHNEVKDIITHRIENGINKEYLSNQFKEEIIKNAIEKFNSNISLSLKFIKAITEKAKRENSNKITSEHIKYASKIYDLL